MAHDAFISYSHESDTDLAPDLQEGLQRLSKPWYRRGPFLTVVRDSTNFGASSSLESVIHEALNDANHLVLLLSPDSAQSPWINKEVAHWIATKGVKKMTFAVTDWRDEQDLSDFDWNGADVPAALHGHVDEPLIVDLRWAKSAADRTLKNDQWQDNVAAIASGILGKNKDELVGTVLAMRARARILTGTIAIAAVVLLAITAFGVGGWLLADRARSEAVQARDLAEAQQLEAERARDQARSAQSTAEQAAAEAVAAVAAAEANLRQAQIELIAAGNELTATQNDLTEAKSNLDLAEATLETARLELSEAQAVLETTEENLKVAEADLATATAESERQQTIARSVAAGSRSIALIGDDPRTAALIGLTALDTSDTPVARDALLTLTQRSGIRSSIKGHHSAFLGEGNRIAVEQGRAIAIHDALTGELLTEFPPDNDFSNGFSFSKTSGLLAVRNTLGVAVWDVESQTVVSRLSVQSEVPDVVAWDPSGQRIAYLGDELIVWEPTTGQVISRQTHPRRPGADDVNFSTRDIAFSPAGDLIATSADSVLAFWDDNGNPIGDAIDLVQIEGLRNDGNFIINLAFSPDATRLATTVGSGVHLWDTTTRTIESEVRHHEIVTDVAFSNSGKVIATSSLDLSVRLWDAETGEQLDRRSTGWHGSLEFSPDDRYLVADDSGYQVVLDVLETTAPESGGIPGGKIGAMGTGGHLLAIANGPRVSLLDVPTALILSTFEVPEPITAMAFDKPNMHIAVASNSEVSIYSLESGLRTAGPYFASGITEVTMSNNGHLLAFEADYIGVIDLSTGEISRLADASFFGSIAFTSDDLSLVVAELDGPSPTKTVLTSINLENNTREVVAFTTPLIGRGRSMSVAPGGEIFAIGTARGAFRVYDSSSGLPLGDLNGTPRDETVEFRLQSMAFSPDGQHLAFWTPDDGFAIGGVWRVGASGVDSWRQRACQIAGRNLTTADWNRFFPGESYAIQCDQFPGPEDE